MALWTWVLEPAGRAVGWPARHLGSALAAAARGLWTALKWTGRTLVAVPARWLYGAVLTPLGRAVAWSVRTLLVRPVLWLAREAGAALGICWQVAGYVSRALGRAVKWLAWNALGRPLARAYRTVMTPVGHWLRDDVWRPARRAAAEAGRSAREALSTARTAFRDTRRDLWRGLVGSPQRPPAPTRPAEASAPLLEKPRP